MAGARDSNRVARCGDASERSYARGGGISGAEPDEAGIRTVSDCACARGAAALASVSGVSAPSAVMHGMVAAHVPDAGPEQGASCDVVSPAASVTDAACFVPASPIAMPGMDVPALGPSVATLPDIGAIPGTTHRAPPATMLRWPTKRAIRRPAERRMRLSIN